ncbi:DUF1592 domain-containing protein [Paraglaciecola sp. L3A3]|uniref:DUF1592 domain-containing protein n=1 Tax=Paraglaciecola sp. L3A3 TaxID=2686358 RepID=UPI00131E65E0|nr:DUF1592 domain-containing protein [Paraglaciecola sp. L3A3]
MSNKRGQFLTLLSLLLACVAVASVIYIAQLNPLDGIEGQGLGRFLGRFHPLVLHFPVTCLILAGLFELMAHVKLFAFLKRLVGPILFCAAFSAVSTVVLGLLLAANEGHQGALIERHRMFGITVAVLSCVAWVMYVSAQNQLAIKLMTWGYRATLFAAICMMSLAAHDGGALVHGPNYLAEHSPKILVPILTNHLPENNDLLLQNSDYENQTKHYISETTFNRFDTEVGSLVEGYCLRCHGESKQEANLRLDKADPSFNHFNSQHEWQRILGVLGSHKMPPDSAKQPSDRQRMTAINWIQTALEEHAYSRRADMAKAPLRRLNKRELNYTYQDLFNVDPDFVSQLPADPKSAHGYDNDAQLLMVSMSDISAYHDIARQAVNRYVKFGKRQPQKTEKYFVELEDVYHFGRAEGDRLSYERAGQPLTDAELATIKQQGKTQKVIYRQRTYGPLPYGDIPQGKSSAGEGRGFARLHEQFMLLRTSNTVGEVVVKVNAAMTPGKQGDTSVPRLRLEAGWRNEQSLRVKNVGEYDVTQDLTNPQSFEFRFRLEDVIEPKMVRGDHQSHDRWILLVLSNVSRHADGVFAASIYGQSDFSLPSASTVGEALQQQGKKAKQQQESGIKQWRDKQTPMLYLDSLQAEVIPVEAGGTSPWFIKYPGQNTGLDKEKARLKSVLLTYLPKVFRKQQVSQQTYLTYLNLFEKLRNQGDSFTVAVKETMAAALIAPEFLYIGYGQNEAGFDLAEEHENELDIRLRYDNQYLASRLSYYLWSSMPDDTLTMLADKKQLTDPAVLAEQVERMLADPKAQRFTQTFAKQWLQLAKLEDVTVSPDIYPEYGNELAQLTIQQSVATFQDIFHHNRDARELYFSDHMMLNQQLARLYQVPNVSGGDLIRVKTDSYPPRLGLMTQASVLAMNSDGEDSHPIKRGVWMLERLFNDPPPPPPPSVPELDPNNPVLAGLSLKQKIEHHRKLSGCSGCHEKIDPWGILMENYDATGMWRNEVSTYKKVELDEAERRRQRKRHVMQVVNKMEVDASSILPDGTTVSSVADLSTYLQQHKQTELMQALVQHMMMYALGRDLDILDEQESAVIYAAFRASGYKLSKLVQAIVNSDGFTNRQLQSKQTSGNKEKKVG